MLIKFSSIAIFIFFPITCLGDFSFQLNEPRFESFLIEIADLLPQKFKKTIGKPIQIQFSELDDQYFEKINYFCSINRNASSNKNKIAYTKYRFSSNKIILNRQFKSEILKGSQFSTTTCLHGTVYRLAIAVILHELAHMYDSKIELEEDNTQRFYNSRKKDQNHIKRVRRVSETPQFLALVNFRRSKEWELNFWASPNPDEFRNVKENFAVNFEYFLLDPTFKCRRPALYHFLSQHFSHFPKSSCDTNNRIFSTSGKSIILDTTRLHSIRFLYGERVRDRIYSRWGHSFLHLVFCAPSKNHIDPTCLEDYNHHITIDFTAKNDEYNFNNFKGLFGHYISSINIHFFRDIQKESKMTRDLYSLPIYLSREEEEFILKRILEIYWGYKSKYFFITNNCTHELGTVIESALSVDHLARQKGILLRNSIHPGRILKSLYHAGLTPNDINSPEVISFPSKKDWLQRSFNNLSNWLPEGFSIKRYIRSELTFRRRLLADINAISDRIERIPLLASMMILEKNANKYALKVIKREAYRNMSEDLKKNYLDNTPAKNIYLPQNFVSAEYQYGVPLTQELLSEDVIRLKWESSISAYRSLQRDILAISQDEIDSLNDFYNEIHSSFN